MMRDAIACRIHTGLQAAITLGIHVVAILSNGLVLEFENEQQQARWYRLKAQLFQSRALQWKETEWYERGYKLVEKEFPQHKSRKLKDHWKRTYTKRLLIPLKESEKISG